MSKTLVLKKHTENNYVVFGEEYFSLKIKDCRCYTAGLVDKSDGIKKPCLLIPVEKLEDFLDAAIVAGYVPNAPFRNILRQETTKTVEVSKKIMEKKDMPDYMVEEKTEFVFNLDLTPEDEEQLSGFLTPRKKGEITTVNKLIDIKGSSSIFERICIYDSGNVRFHAYYQARKIYITWEFKIAVISFEKTFWLYPEITTRENSHESIDEFIIKFILDMRNGTIQPFTLSQTRIAGQFFVYFYIKKFQIYDKKTKDLVERFLNVDTFTLESDLLLEHLNNFSRQ